MASRALESILRRDRLVVAVSLACVCLLSWLFLIHLSRQMETMEGMAARMMMMPVGDTISALLGAALSPAAAALADATVNFALVALMWAVMMVGMMTPSAAPTILLFSALERKRAATERTGSRIACFVAGYFESGCFPAPCCRRAAQRYAFRYEESGSQHDFGCC